MTKRKIKFSTPCSLYKNVKNILEEIITIELNVGTMIFNANVSISDINGFGRLIVQSSNGRVLTNLTWKSGSIIAPIEISTSLSSDKDDLCKIFLEGNKAQLHSIEIENLD